MQVNALSTVLLALLLLPGMKQGQELRGNGSALGATPHLVFVSSGVHFDPDITEWPNYVETDGGILAHFNKPGNFPSGLKNPMYGISKLFLMYDIQELCKMALGSDERCVLLPQQLLIASLMLRYACVLCLHNMLITP